MSQLLSLFLGIGLVFGALAGSVAYLITYEEYTKHYRTAEEPKKMALGAAIFAFAVFFSITLAIGLFMPGG